VYAVGSTKKALKRAKDAGIPTLGSGSVAGIPAILLNEGTCKPYCSVATWYLWKSLEQFKGIG
jgi:3-methyladenine DNA glycosylase/8-oxoguanine DNA glycosylase